jgi:hypothetical protein
MGSALGRWARLARSAAALIGAGLIVAGCLDGISTSIQAATPDTAKDVPSGFEIVVFERPDCTTCQLFRRDVAPRYEASIRGGTAPLRYVDLTGKKAANDGRHDRVLATPLRMLPTAVIVQDGREFARIEGYTGPDNFFQMVSYAFKQRSGQPAAMARPSPITRN